MICKDISEDNKSILEKVPHKIIEDLAVIYYFILENNESNCSSIMITKSLLNELGWKENNLYEMALENTQKLFPLEIVSISEFLLAGLVDEKYLKRKVEEDAEILFVVTNQKQSNGATVMLYPEVIEFFSKKWNNFYILPSSTHEVLICPAFFKPMELKEIVKSVNATIESCDILSDEVYYYDKEEKRIRIAY